MFGRKVRSGVGVTLLLTVLMLGACAPKSKPGSSTAEQAPTIHQVLLSQRVALDLAAGRYAWQGTPDILFLGDLFAEGTKPTLVIAYSVADQQERWRTELTATPLNAWQAGDTYLVATAPAETNHDNQGHLVALATDDGHVLWDQVLGEANVAVTGLGSRVWVAAAAGVVEIDPQTGATIGDVVAWQERPRGNARTVHAYTYEGRTQLVLSGGQELYAYEESATGWTERWHFHAASPVMETGTVVWEAGQAPHVEALAFGAAYDIKPDGTTGWRITNQDVNQGMQLVSCGDGTVRYVFGNVASGVYLVGSAGVERSWQLPGGQARLGPIPLPIAANPTFGVAAGDLNGDGQDEIIARSPKALFVFDCRGRLLGSTALNDGTNDSLVSQIRGLPGYRPFVLGAQLVVAEKGQLSYFTLQ